MGFLRQTAKQLLTSCLSRDLLLTHGARTRLNQPPRLALTFDDGPHPIHTPLVLDLLQSAGARATFFVIGKQAEAHPDLIRRMHDDGHEVANHTWTHSLPAETSPARFLDEVRRTDELIHQLTGVVPALMRPPKGELNIRKLMGLWRLRKTVALWNIDPRDYLMTEPRQIDEWASKYVPQDGDILLFHDNHPHAIKALEHLQQRGDFDRFQAVAARDLISRNVRNVRNLTPVT